MKKHIFMYTMVLMILFLGSMQKGNCQDYDMEVQESNLRYNEEFIIGYGPDAKLADSSRIAVLVYEDLLQPPKMLEMHKRRDVWAAEYVLSDTSVKMILLAFQALDGSGKPIPECVDNKNDKYWSRMVTDENEKPVRGANMAEALSYTGLGNLRETDLDAAMEYLEKELSLYPDNYSALKLKYSILFRKFEYSSYIRQKIDEEVTRLVDEKPYSEKILNFALEIYKMIGNNEKVEEIEERIIHLNPKGDRAATRRLNVIMNIEDPAARLDSLEMFLQDFPDSRFREIVLSGISTAAIEINDFEKMKEVGDMLLTTANQPAGAGSLAGIAGILTEKRKDLKRAVQYAEKALDLAVSFAKKKSPPEISEKDWEEQNQRLQARYKDVLGWALYNYGKPAEGLRYLKEAAEVMPQSSTYYHYGKALLMEEGAGIKYAIQKPDSAKEYVTITAGLEEALEYLAGAVAFGGQKGDEAYDLLEIVWLKAGRDTTELSSLIEKQTKRVEEELQQRILAKRDIRPAPDFDLETLNGDWVRLSDQKGTVIVLTFWATWSKSSLKMLNEQVKLADVYGDSVLFITISTDFDWRRAADFVRKTRFPLPVLLNDETDEKYGLHGVPAVFVIDKKLNIHFDHKGYSQNIKEVLAIEIESLLEL